MRALTAYSFQVSVAYTYHVTRYQDQSTDQMMSRCKYFVALRRTAGFAGYQYMFTINLPSLDRGTPAQFEGLSPHH